MITLLLPICGIAAVIPLIWYVLSRLGLVSATLNITDVLRASVLAALSALWLIFASTYLFWLLPVALIACGYFGHILGAIITEKPNNSPWLVLASVGVAGLVSVYVFSRHPDSAFGYLPDALLIANYILYLGFAAVRLLRPKTTSRQRITYIVTLIATVPLIFTAYHLGLRSGALQPAEIIDFRPISFPAVANGNFFYSVGDDLKYSDQIDPKTPTILHSRIKNFLVSPDGKRMAAVMDGRMKIISGESGDVRDVMPVRTIYETSIPVGVSFFRDNHYQWSRDSKSLYLIKDEYYESGPTKIHPSNSEKGELWKYEVETESLQLVFKPFRSSNYFLGESSGVYFSVPNAEGNLQLMKYDGAHAIDVDNPNARDITDNMIQPDRRKTVFYSFSSSDYEKVILPSKGVRVITQRDQPQELVIGNRTVLRVERGDLRGLNNAAFLPGDRYFLLSVHSSNHNGQLLIDTTTGDNMTLKNTRVYVTENTESYQYYKINAGGIKPISKPQEQATLN